MGRPGEPRNYKREAAQEDEQRKQDRRDRMKARYDMEKKHGKAALKGKDIDHKKPLRDGGGNSASNLRVADPKKNRGWRKGKSGYD